MSNEQFITIVGRLSQDPELRFTPSGAAVANLSIASNARKYDKQSDSWKDETTTFWRCNAWRDLAENVAESLQKGMAVVAYGEIKSRSFDTKEGDKRTVLEVELTAIGPDLRWSTAKVQKAQRGSGGSQGFGGSQGAGGAGSAPQQPAQPAEDPWSTGGGAKWDQDPAF